MTGIKIFPMYFTDIDTNTSDAPMLYINEIMADNVTAVSDENGDFDDWIELYNPNAEEVFIGGLYITNDASDLGKYQIPGTSLASIMASSHELIWADGESSEGDLHTNFQLDSEGGYVAISYEDGCELTILDSIDYTALEEDQSYGREEDGSSVWVVFEVSTPGAMNENLSVEGINTVSLTAWPNPSNGGIVNFSKPISFNLYDITGRPVMQQNNVIQLNADDLSEGIYLLETTEGEAMKLILK